MGSAQTLKNGGYTFEAGMIGPVDSRYSRAVETPPEGQVVYAQQLGGMSDYRTFRLADMYSTPLNRPAQNSERGAFRYYETLLCHGKTADPGLVFATLCSGASTPPFTVQLLTNLPSPQAIGSPIGLVPRVENAAKGDARCPIQRQRR